MLLGDYNKNETPEHFELKQIAKLLLWERGFKHIATEVCGFYSPDEEFLMNGKAGHTIIDVVGARTSEWKDGKISRISLMGMEAKASRSDFRNGYCTACEYTYVIAPKGVVPPDELIPGVGLIEVDLKNYRIGTWGGIWYEGITTVVKAKSRLAPCFQSKADRDKWVLTQFRRIAYRATVENVFSNPNIKIEDKPVNI